MEDEEITEDVDDPPAVEEIVCNVDVPIIHISTECEKRDGSVEYVKIVPSEAVEYENAVVTLSDGTIQIEIPVSQGKLQNEQSTEANTVVQIGENETIILNDNGTSFVGSPFFMLEDGRITFIRAFNKEECIVSDQQVSVEEKQSLEGTTNCNKPTKKKGKSHFCKVAGCGRVYSSLHHLKVHSRNHSGDRPFKCTVEGCSKAFNTDYSRKAHLRTHTGEKPYSCPSTDCRKSFKTSGDLQKHIRIHTGERPFVCPVDGCNRSFTTSNIRKVHIRTHTGERPYKCTYEGCNRSFASSTNFKNHMRIHSGEKPYCCPVPNCLKRFTEYSSLYKHQLVHCQLKRHPCQYCHKTYRQSSTLVTHKRTNHGLISAEDGTEIILEQMIGVGEDGTKNFKNITSKLLNLKNENDPLELTVEEENAPLYIISELNNVEV